MRQALAVLACLFLLALPLCADEVTFGPGMSSSNLGGIMIVRQGGQTTFSLGGVLFPRQVTTRTVTPEGPVITRFTLPSLLHSPNAIPFLEYVPATILVEIPDNFGLLYVNGKLLPTFGLSRQLESPPLPPGKTVSLKIRGAFRVGDHLLIEDKTVVLHAGQSIRVRFEGDQAVAVPLPKDTWAAPPPAVQPSK